MDANDVTFWITHYLRPDDLIACIESIRKFFPNAAIDTEDTRGNLSRARNRLVSRCKTKYGFLLEEDMRLRKDTNVAAMHRILEEFGDILGVGGAIREPIAGTRAIAAQYRKAKNSLVLEDAAERRVTRAGDALVVCSLIYNYGLFRVRDLREYRWNEQLELAEHYEFYWHVQERGVHRLACCSSVIDHLNTRPNRAYAEARRRIGHFRNVERRMLGGRKLIRNYTSHALQSPTAFRAIVVGGPVEIARAASDQFDGPFCASKEIDRLVGMLPKAGRWRIALRGNGAWKLYCRDTRKALLVAQHFHSYRPPLLYIEPRESDEYAAYLPELLQTWPYSVIRIA